MITLLDGDLDSEWFTAARTVTRIGCDIETSGLSREKDTIATFQMYVPNKGTVMVRHLNTMPIYLIRLLTLRKPMKIFHYGNFDLGFLLRDYPMIRPNNFGDTKIAAKLVDPRRTHYIDPITNKGSHSLRSLVYNEFGFLMDKTLAVSDWFAPELSQQQLEYAAKDVEYLPALLSILERKLRKIKQLHIAREAYEFLPTKVLLDLKGTDVYSYE